MANELLSNIRVRANLGEKQVVVTLPVTGDMGMTVDTAKQFADHLRANPEAKMVVDAIDKAIKEIQDDTPEPLDEETRAEYEKMLALCKAAKEEQLAKEWPDEEVLLDIDDEIRWYEVQLGLR